MPEESRVQMRRRQRRRTNNATTVLAAVAALVVVAALSGGALWFASRRPAPQTRRPLQNNGATSVAATASGTKLSAKGQTKPAAITPASDPATQTAVSPETAAAAAASGRAVKKAAVQFPDAPSIAVKASISQLEPRHKYVALTLDDGYNFQPEMLALLKKYDARCTTFLVGSWAASHKKEVKRMRDAGFEIANHSWSHPFLTKLSTSQIERQLSRTQRAITSVTGNQAPYLRPPFGDTDGHVKSAAADMGYRIVLWNRSFGDSGRGATPRKLYRNVVESHGGVEPGDIILCHWGSKPSYEALKRILPDLQAQGYQFVTVSELIADSKPAK